MKETFKGIIFKTSTWELYAKTLINWFNYTTLDIKEKLAELQKGRRSVKHEDVGKLFLRTSPKELKKGLLSFSKDPEKYSNGAILRDLNVLNLVDNDKKLSETGMELLLLTEDNFNKELSRLCLKLPLMNEILEKFRKNVTNSNRAFSNLLPNDLLIGIKESSKNIYISKLKSWAKFNYEITSGSLQRQI